MVGITVSNIGLNEFGSPFKSRRKDIVDVTCDFASEKPYALLKTLHVFPELFMRAGFLPDDNPELNNACLAARMGKLSRAPFEFIKYTHTTLDSFARWLKGETKEFKEKYKKKIEREVAITDVLRDANNCVNPVWEMADFLTRAILFIPKTAVRTLEGVNGIALTIGMAWNVFDTLNWIRKSEYSSLQGADRDKKFSDMTGYLMKLAKEISYIALGVLIVLSVFFQFVFAPLTVSAISASTVVFTILEYYHENLWTKKELT
ncbi:MAG: hypothetical protein K940chlam6_00790 [Chlamydiae bacterium]|nr:hypothetical protein [Chlamydiota bacterium]